MWIQRDLEDLIEEAKRESQMAEQPRDQGSQEQSGMRQVVPPPQKKVSLKEVRELLSKGFTRYKKDDKGYGSIQEKFHLTSSQVKGLFMHAKLRGLKTTMPGPEIVDDLETPSSDIQQNNSLFD